MPGRTAGDASWAAALAMASKKKRVSQTRWIAAGHAFSFASERRAAFGRDLFHVRDR